MSIFLYNFTYLFFIWTVTQQCLNFIFLRNIWTIQLQKIWKFYGLRNRYFHQINASNNVFSFIVYINFAPKCHFPCNFQIKILGLECRWLSFFIFLFGRAYYKEVYFKKEKTNYGKENRHPIYLKVRDQNHFCTRLRRDLSQLSINPSFFKFPLTEADVKFGLVKFC